MLSYAGKVVNVRHLNDVVNSVNGWYAENGLFGLVSACSTLKFFGMRRCLYKLSFLS